MATTVVATILCTGINEEWWTNQCDCINIQIYRHIHAQSVSNHRPTEHCSDFWHQITSNELI